MNWLKELSDNFNLDTCTSVVNEFNSKLVEKDPEISRLQQHQVMSMNYQLENSSQDIHFRLQNIFKRMMTSGIENSKAVQEQGENILAELRPFILTYPGLIQALCLNQLNLNRQKISDLESGIEPDSFAIQMHGELLLLDELFTEIAFCGQIGDLMNKFNLINDSLYQRLSGFVGVYSEFKKLIGSYFAIILQEGLKNCQREDGAMEQASLQILDIIQSGSYSAFVDLIQNLNSNSGSLTSGQMILMAMNSLLDNIDNQLVKSGELQDKNLLQKLSCISEFFEVCFRSMNSFKADLQGQMFPNGDEMGFPIIKYMAGYYLKYLRGHVTDLLDQIIKSGLDASNDIQAQIASTMSEARDKGQFLSLEMNAIFSNLRKTELALNLEFKVEILNANQQINQLQRNSFQWYHEDSLPLQIISPVQPLRPQVLSDMKSCLATLVKSQKELTEINTRYQDLNATVDQRLKWACGANPDLQEVFDNFSSAYAAEMEVMKSLISITRALSASANTIVNYESLRTTSREALSADSALMSLFAECQQSVQLQDTQAANAELGALELSIFTINPPEDLINKKWIKKTTELITEQVRAINREIEEDKERMKGTQAQLQAKIGEFKKTLTSHQKLMADVGSLLRSIDKTEELEVPEIKTYLAKYRDFTDQITSMLKKLNEDFTDEKVSEIISDMDGLKDIIPEVYDNLVSLASNLKEENIEQFKKPGGQVEVKDNENANTSVAEAKNDFALSVLRRIKTKLDGREPDVLRKSSVGEQVDFIIREATNVDNLALLYEGSNFNYFDLFAR